MLVVLVLLVAVHLVEGVVLDQPDQMLFLILVVVQAGLVCVLP
jgi:hypothetical protein